MDNDRYLSLPHINLSGRIPHPSYNTKQGPGTLKASFEDHRVEKNNKEKFVLYSIRMHNILFDYVIYKRFSEFEVLYAKLRELFPNLILPRLPEKFFFNNFDEGKIIERKAKLEKFLNDLILLLMKDNNLGQLFEFIELRTHKMHSVLDLNNSNFLITDKCALEYIKLIYEKNKLEKNIRRLRSSIMKQKVNMSTVELMLKGSESFVGLFVIAFSHQKYFEHYLDEKPDLTAKKAQSKSFSMEHNTSMPIMGSYTSVPTVHHTCMIVSSFILDLLDPCKNTNAKIFRDVFKDSGSTIFSSAEFKGHLCAKTDTMCKRNCYEILKIYKDLSNNLDEFFLFTEVDEYRKFNTWYHKQMKTLRKESLFDDAEAKFPNIKDILFNNQISENFIFKIMDIFMDKQNLNLLSFEEDRNLAKLSFDIKTSKREEFIKSIADFSWSSNVVKLIDHSMQDSDIIYIENSQMLCMRTLFFKKEDHDGFIFYTTVKFYNITKGDRMIVLLAPQDSMCNSQENAKILYDPNYDGDDIFVTEDIDIGFFIDMEPFEDNETRLRVSLLMNHSFFNKKRESSRATFDYFKSRIRTIRDSATALFS